jgi:tRNA dimethylallyltransferase
MSSPKLIVVVGPTAVGKTALCVRLAQALHTDVVSADARQFYRQLHIGTAKPSLAERQDVLHHLIDSHDITSYFTVGDFEREALQILDQIFQKKQTAILTGGSGLFVKALTDGLDDMPEAPLELRAQLTHQAQQEGLAPLLDQLQQLDPIIFAQIDLQNTQRVIRALEVCLSTGRPFSSFHQKPKKARPFDCIKIGLERPREELYARIDARMEAMLAEGLLEEAREVWPFREHYALQTVGYKEVFDWMDGLYDQDEMVRLLKRNSRRYAKRQLTWFRNQDDFRWFHPDDWAGIMAYIQSALGDVC